MGGRLILHAVRRANRVNCRSRWLNDHILLAFDTLVPFMIEADFRVIRVSLLVRDVSQSLFCSHDNPEVCQVTLLFIFIVAGELKLLGQL